MAAQKKAWDQMALFNQKVLKNIIGGRQELGNPEDIAAVATMSNQQKSDTILFTDSETEALENLHDGSGLQKIVDVKALIKKLPLIQNEKLPYPDQLFQNWIDTKTKPFL